MTDEPTLDAEAPLPEVTPAPESLDPRRLRSFIGLTLARLGPQAYGDVSGTFLALLVGEQTRNLFAATFALTAHRLITWLAYPIAGRLSDKSHTVLGRRVPFMAAGLLITGVCMALLTHMESYWSLVALLVLARLAFVVYNIPASAVTPETFGASRWIRALVLVGVGGVVVGLSIRVTVIATWNQNDPTTWRPAYYLAAAYVVFAAFSIVALVREAPAAQRLADRAKRDHDMWAAARSTWRAPNAKPLLIGLLLAVAAGGAVDRIYPLYARDVLGVGGKQLAYRGIFLGPAIAILMPGAWWLARRLTRKQAAMWAGVAGFASAIAHFWITEIWQSIAVTAVSTMFFVASAIVLVPLFLQILPREGGLAERFGVAFSPLLLAGLLGGYSSALAYDLIVHEYWVVWFISGLFGLGGGLAFMWLKLPPGAERDDPMNMVKTLTRLYKQRSAGKQLFRGVIETKEADGTQLLEVLADELNPYAPAHEPALDGTTSIEDRLQRHLQEHYGTEVTALLPPDNPGDVFRVERADGPDWLARLFHADRPIERTSEEVEILRFLEEQGFPAERLAHADPVSTLDGRGVLVTEFVEGSTADNSTDTLRTAGELLGRLHALPSGPGALMRDGGSWHGDPAHEGLPSKDIEAGAAWLAQVEDRVPAEHRPAYDTLRDLLARADGCDDLPRALVHPDFVHVNLISTPDDRLVAVDWTGAGRGPRVASLANLLASAAMTTGGIDAVIAGYRTNVQLSDDEVSRLAGAIGLRPLLFACWYYRSSVLSGWTPTGTEPWWPRAEFADAAAAKAREALSTT